MSEQTTEQENNRNPDGTFKEGFSGNPGGRPKGLKNHDQEKFAKMTSQEKDKFLSKISPELRYRMAEGNPHQTSDEKHEVEVKPILVKFIDGAIKDNKDTD